MVSRKGKSKRRTYNLSSSHNSETTMRVLVYKLATPNVNPYEQIEKWLGYFSKLPESIGDAAWTMTKDLAESIVGGIQNVLTGTADEKIKSAITALVSELVHAGAMADDGAFAVGEYVSEYIIDLPQNLTNRLSHQYDTDELSTEEMILRKFPAYMAAKAVSPAIHEKIGKMAALSFELAKRQGRTIDPNIITTYRGTDMREFMFTTNIIIQSKEHGKKVLAGIMNLKIFLTGIRESLDIYQDHCFKIKFNNNKIDQYMMLHDAELNLIRLDVDFGSDGSMQLYDDGTPKHIQLTLSFQERRPLRREGYGDTTTATKTSKPVTTTTDVPLSNRPAQAPSTSTPLYSGGNAGGHGAGRGGGKGGVGVRLQPSTSTSGSPTGNGRRR